MVVSGPISAAASAVRPRASSASAALATRTAGHRPGLQAGLPGVVKTARRHIGGALEPRELEQRIAFVPGQPHQCRAVPCGPGECPPPLQGGEPVLDLLAQERDACDHGQDAAADKQVAKYSKGMTQRIGVAQALLHEPDLLILDEPTASLDPVARHHFRELLLELKGRGKTILISSHILSEVESVCDRVGILENGRLKRIGTLQELSAEAPAWSSRKSPGPAMEALAATAAEVTWFQGQPDHPLSGWPGAANR